MLHSQSVPAFRRFSRAATAPHIIDTFFTVLYTQVGRKSWRETICFLQEMFQLLDSLARRRLALAMDSKLWRFTHLILIPCIICFCRSCGSYERRVYALLWYIGIACHYTPISHINVYSILRRRLIIFFLDMSTGRFIVSSKRFGLWPVFNFQGAVSFLTVCMIAWWFTNCKRFLVIHYSFYVLHNNPYPF